MDPAHTQHRAKRANDQSLPKAAEAQVRASVTSDSQSVAVQTPVRTKILQTIDKISGGQGVGPAQAPEIRMSVRYLLWEVEAQGRASVTCHYQYVPGRVTAMLV